MVFFLSFILTMFVIAYVIIAATPIRSSRIAYGSIDFSYLILQAERISAIPFLIPHIPSDDKRRHSLALFLGFIGLLPLWLIPFTWFISKHTITLLIPYIGTLLFLLLVTNRVLRFSLGMLGITKICGKHGLNPTDWIRCTQHSKFRDRSFLTTFMRTLAAGIIVVSLGGLIPFLLSFFLFWLAGVRERRKIKREDAILSSHDLKADILYLRAFDDDNLMSQIHPFIGHTLEQNLVGSLASGHNNVVALGKPEEKAPPLGAIRTYETNNTWQDTISQWIRESEQIVMIASTTQATKWEKEEISNLKQLKKLLILFPSRKKDRLRETFERVKELTGKEFKKEDTPKIFELEGRRKVMGISFLNPNEPTLLTSATTHPAGIVEIAKWHYFQISCSHKQ